MVKLTWLSFIALMLAVVPKTNAQFGVCSILGQTPPTAFPVCGTSKFVQTTVPICGSKEILVPGCSSQGNAGYFDKNPFWYKFTCFQSGTLGFIITPNDLGDDYDWQLFDITGHSPNEVFTNSSLFVVANWAGTYGLTGASGSALGKVQCASNPADNVPTFSHWPTLIKGHKYLLLISHFTDSQSGYTLTFGGGTASITDTVQPHLKGVGISCDASNIFVKLNKRLICNSVAADGSDFMIASGTSSIVAATGYNCGNSFDMDSVQLILDKPLPPGNYMLIAKNGTDANTLLDVCGAAIPAGEQIPFIVSTLQPTPFDSIAPPACAPDVLHLVFSKRIQCSSIAPDGSDFTINGSSVVGIVSAGGSCDGGLSNIIDVKLSAPIYKQGSYQVKLITGLDGNTIIDECGQTTLAGGVVNFTTADTVSAKFTANILYGCAYDTILLNNSGGASISQWQWNYDSAQTSDLKSPMLVYSQFGDKNIQLIVSNGICSDTASAIVSLDNAIKAAFEAPDLLCPADKASFVNNSTGHLISWDWVFGDGTSDFGQLPPDHIFPKNPMADQTFTVSLMVEDNLGCRDTATQQVRALHSCYIAVPSAFTPNGDGINDYLYPLNAFKADNLEFRVYNRYGQLVFETQDWTKKWDGKLNGQLQSIGTYVWTLRYTDRDLGKKIFKKGSSVLIR